MKKAASSSNHPHSTSIEAITGNQDLLLEIVMRLPPKSVAKLKCTSKQFLSFISNPYLERRYSLLHPPSFAGLFLIPTKISYCPEIEYVSLSPHDMSAPSLNFLASQGFSIVQSCNGLLLCRSRISGKQRMTYHVCNPTTRQFVDLPRCPYMRGYFSVLLAFDPLNSPYYKVVCVQRMDDSYQGLCQVSIYTPKTGLWTSLGEPLVASQDSIDFRHGVYCNGNIHWMKGAKSKGLYFDVSNNCFKLMPELPFEDNNHKYIYDYFGHSQGYLHYVVTSPNLQNLEVFEMDKAYSGWLFKFRIDLSTLAHKFPRMARKSIVEYPNHMSYECDVMSVIRGRNKSHIKVLLSIPGELIAYNHKKKTSWKVCDHKVCADERHVWCRTYSAYEYYETMSSI